MWNENNSSLVEQREIKRIVSLCKEYGIREEAIGVHPGKIAEFLCQDYYEKDNISCSDVANAIYKAQLNWSNKGIVLLIESTEPTEEEKKNYSNIDAANLREYFGEICLFRFVLYSASSPNRLITSLRMSEMTTKLSTFDQSRFSMANQLLSVPCLFVREVDIQEAPRDTNDCLSLLDSIFFNRIRNNKPTIISLPVLSEKFVTPDKFGKGFSTIIQTRDKKKVFKIRLK